MADTRTIWIQTCIDAIRAHRTSVPSCDESPGHGMRTAIGVLEKMLTAEPTGGNGITVDGEFDQEPEKPVRTKFTAREMMDR